MELLQFEGVDLGYGRDVVLRGVNMRVGRGDFFGLVGPNGSGKSTLLKAMLGLVKSQAGEIRWHPRVPKRGYVPQREQIDPIWPMRVRDLLRLTLCSLRGGRLFGEREPAAVPATMEMIEIEHLANQTLDTLSGGEMQRVLLARALIVEPEVLLLDEPTAAMDLVASQKYLSVITRLHHECDVTVIIVTHDLPSLIGRAHRLGIIQHGHVHSGLAGEMLTSEKLSDIYKEPMMVKKLDGHTVIFRQAEIVPGAR